MAKNMKIGAAVLTLLILTTSCGSPPRTYEFDKSTHIQANFETVWPAVVQFFAEQNIPIKTLEKASGLVAAENQYFPEEWVDCGSPGLNTQSEAIGTFNVFVRDQGEAVLITVNCSFTCERWLGDSDRQQYQCNSTGEFEVLFMQYIRDNVG